MASINVNDINEEMTISDEEVTSVKGGAGYLKIGDIKGEVAGSRTIPTENFSLNYEKIRF